MAKKSILSNIVSGTVTSDEKAPKKRGVGRPRVADPCRKAYSLKANNELSNKIENMCDYYNLFPGEFLKMILQQHIDENYSRILEQMKIEGLRIRE